MHEIKFRVWDKKAKQMSSPFGLVDIRAYDGEVQAIWFEAGGAQIVIGNDLGYGKNDNAKLLSRYIFLQYTGLRDKNGKEIYDGNIVRYEYGGVNFWTVKRGYDGWILARGERITGDNNCEDDPHYNRWEMAEVVGNVYEHPDLVR